MHSIKGGWVGQTFALAKRNESEGRKTRIRRSKEERKDMVEIFIKKYQKLNDGKFPSLSLTHRECGGSFYTIREIVREVIQENRVLGPAKLTPNEKDNDQLFEQFPVGTMATGPQSSSFSSSDGNMLTINHNQVASKESVLNSDSVFVGFANSTSQEQNTDKNLEQHSSVTIPIIPEHYFSLSSNGFQSSSDQTVTSEEQVSNSDFVILEAEPLSLKSENEVNRILVGVKMEESSNINLTESQTDIQTELFSDGVIIEAEILSLNSEKEVSGNLVDVKNEESSNINPIESQIDKQIKSLSDGVGLEEEPPSLKIANENLVDLKIEESSNMSSTNSQPGKQTETGKSFEHLAESKAKITDITENVTVETFPIIKPVTKTISGLSGKPGEQGELPMDGKSDVHEKGNVQLPGSGVVSDGLKQRETNFINVTYTPNISTVKSVAKKVENKPDVKRSSSLQKASNPTLDRINLSKAWNASEKRNKAESNPLVSILQSFIEAFVKFWTE